jgi:ActR/RegA family two-component response regulator
MNATPSRLSKDSRHSNTRVLIVENREETRATLHNSLNLWGYTTFLAEGNGTRLLENAREKARKHRCHLAVVDKRLMDDRDLADYSGLKLIKSIAPTVAIILTGYAEFTTARSALMEGAFDVVRKEAGPRALQDALTRAMDEIWLRKNDLHIECSPVLRSEALIRRLFPNDADVPGDEVEDTLRRLFPTARRLRLELPSGDDSPSNLLLRMRSVVVKVYEDDAKRPCIVKIARARRTEEEIERFNGVRHSFTTGRYAHIRGEPIQLWDLGGVIYEFIGEDNKYPIETFADFYSHQPSERIKAAIDNFISLWQPLYKRTPPTEQEESLIVAYSSAWGEEWLQELTEHKNLPSGIEEPMLIQQLDLPHPIHWLLDKLDVANSETLDSSVTPYTELVTCHGDLHSRNMFVDTRNDVWVIDYERAGYGPCFQDIGELAVDVLTTLSKGTNNLHEFLNLLVLTLAPTTLEPDSNADTAPGALRKELDVLVHFIALARQTSNKSDAKPFYWTLLLNTLFRLVVFLKDWRRLSAEQQAQPQDALSKDAAELKSLLIVRIQKCFLLGAVLAHRLQNWRVEWPPSEWPTNSNSPTVSPTTDQRGEDNMPTPMPILFLAANPAGMSRLQLDKEYRQIREALQKAGHRDRFKLENELAVRVGELIQLLVQHKPAILHFCGHGSAESEIILEDDYGRGHALPHEAVTKIFGILNRSRNQIRCVVLNACFTEQQARFIAEYVDFVVGIDSEIGDQSAIAFAGAFYTCLAEKQDVQTAFELAKANIGLHRLGFQDTVRLLTKAGIDPSSSYLV